MQMWYAVDALCYIDDIMLLVTNGYTYGVLLVPVDSSHWRAIASRLTYLQSSAY